MDHWIRLSNEIDLETLIQLLHQEYDYSPFALYLWNALFTCMEDPSLLPSLQKLYYELHNRRLPHVVNAFPYFNAKEMDILSAFGQTGHDGSIAALEFEDASVVRRMALVKNEMDVLVSSGGRYKSILLNANLWSKQIEIIVSVFHIRFPSLSPLEKWIPAIFTLESCGISVFMSLLLNCPSERDLLVQLLLDVCEEHDVLSGILDAIDTSVLELRYLFTKHMVMRVRYCLKVFRDCRGVDEQLKLLALVSEYSMMTARKAEVIDVLKELKESRVLNEIVENVVLIEEISAQELEWFICSLVCYNTRGIVKQDSGMIQFVIRKFISLPRQEITKSLSDSLLVFMMTSHKIEGAVPKEDILECIEVSGMYSDSSQVFSLLKCSDEQIKSKRGFDATLLFSPTTAISANPTKLSFHSLKYLQSIYKNAFTPSDEAEETIPMNIDQVNTVQLLLSVLTSTVSAGSERLKVFGPFMLECLSDSPVNPLWSKVIMEMSLFCDKTQSIPLEWWTELLDHLKSNPTPEKCLKALEIVKCSQDIQFLLQKFPLIKFVRILQSKYSLGEYFASFCETKCAFILKRVKEHFIFPEITMDEYFRSLKASNTGMDLFKQWKGLYYTMGWDVCIITLEAMHLVPKRCKTMEQLCKYDLEILQRSVRVLCDETQCKVFLYIFDDMWDVSESYYKRLSGAECERLMLLRQSAMIQFLLHACTDSRTRSEYVYEFVHRKVGLNGRLGCVLLSQGFGNVSKTLAAVTALNGCIEKNHFVIGEDERIEFALSLAIECFENCRFHHRNLSEWVSEQYAVLAVKPIEIIVKHFSLLKTVVLKDPSQSTLMLFLLHRIRSEDDCGVYEKIVEEGFECICASIGV